MMPLYRVAWVVAQFFVYVLFPTRVVKNKEVLAQPGPFILSPNHQKITDPFYIVGKTKHQIFFISKKELFEIPFVRWVLRNLGCFPVDRGQGDLKAIRTALAVLRRGDIFGIFPEGSRNKESTQIGEVHAGAAMIALQSGAPVHPVYLKRGGLFRITRIFVGDAVDFSGLTGKRMSHENIEKGTALIREAMVALHDEAEKGA